MVINYNCHLYMELRIFVISAIHEMR